MLAEPTHSVALGSQQDTGKTLMLAEVIVRAKFKRVLILGVKDSADQWRDRLAEQSDGAIQLRRIDATKTGRENMALLLEGADGVFFSGHQFIASKDWTQVPVLGEDGEPKQKMVKGEPVFKSNGEPLFQSKRKHLNVYKKMRPLDAVVSDESQIHANRKSNGVGTVRSLPTDWKFALSGTIAGNKVENLHTIGRWLWPTAQTPSGEFLIDPALSRWREQWCEMESKYVNGARPVSVVLGEKVPGAIVASWPCWIRLLSPSGEVPVPEIVYVDLNDAERSNYDQAEEEGVMWLRRHSDLEPLVMNLPITKRTRLRAAACGVMGFDAAGDVFFAADTESSKMAKLREILDGTDWAGKQAVIFTHSKTFARMAAARMNGAGYVTGLWTGDVSSKKRDLLKSEFIAGRVRYLVAVIESLSRSYDGLQNAANRVVWLSRSDNNEMNDQAARRTWRSGGDLKGYKSVELIARDTYDEGVFNRDLEKSEKMRQVLAGVN